MTIQKLQLDKTASGHDAEAQMLERLGLADLKKKEGRTEEVIDTVAMYKKAGSGSTLYGIAGGSLGAVGGAELAGAFTDSATIKLLAAIAGGAGGAWAGAKAGDAIERDGGFKVTDEDDGAARHAATALGITGGSLGWSLSKYLMGNKDYGSHALAAALGAAAGGGIGYMATAGVEKKKKEKEKKLINPENNEIVGKQQEAIWSANNAMRAYGPSGEYLKDSNGKELLDASGKRIPITTTFTRVEVGKNKDGSPIYEYYATRNGTNIYTDGDGKIQLREGKTTFGDESHTYKEYRDKNTGHIYRRYTRPDKTTYDQLIQEKVADPKLDFKKNVWVGSIYKALKAKGVDEDKAIYAQNMYDLMAVAYPRVKVKGKDRYWVETYNRNDSKYNKQHRELYDLWTEAGLAPNSMPLPGDERMYAIDYLTGTGRELWEYKDTLIPLGVGGAELIHGLSHLRKNKEHRYKTLLGEIIYGKGLSSSEWNRQIEALKNTTNDPVIKAYLDGQEKPQIQLRAHSEGKLERIKRTLGNSGELGGLTVSKGSLKAQLNNSTVFTNNIDRIYDIFGRDLTINEINTLKDIPDAELKAKLDNANKAANVFDANYRNVGGVIPHINKPAAPPERSQFIKAMFDKPNMDPVVIQDLAAKNNKSKDPSDSYKGLDEAIKAHEAAITSHPQPGDTITFKGEQCKISQNGTFQTKDGTLYIINNDGKAVKLDNSLQPPIRINPDNIKDHGSSNTPDPKAKPTDTPKPVTPTEQGKAQDAVDENKGKWTSDAPKTQPTGVNGGTAPEPQPSDGIQPESTTDKSPTPAKSAMDTDLEKHRKALIEFRIEEDKLFDAYDKGTISYDEALDRQRKLESQLSKMETDIVEKYRSSDGSDRAIKDRLRDSYKSVDASRNTGNSPTTQRNTPAPDIRMPSADAIKRIHAENAAVAKVTIDGKRFTAIGDGKLKGDDGKVYTIDSRSGKITGPDGKVIKGSNITIDGRRVKNLAGLAALLIGMSAGVSGYRTPAETLNL